jgi:signal transduction histidine kinase
MVFRIIQELIGNTLKHAQATEIKITLELKENMLYLYFTENGIGFDINLIKTSNGLGWKNTHARLNLLQGIISVNSQKNKGSQIKITLPNE